MLLHIFCVNLSRRIHENWDILNEFLSYEVTNAHCIRFLRWFVGKKTSSFMNYSEEDRRNSARGKNLISYLVPSAKHERYLDSGIDVFLVK